jgi:cytochrome c-type biogenesis protein CcmH/NrfG
MPSEAVKQATGGSVWHARQVCAMAAVCLLVGLAIGYLFRGSQSPAPTQPQAGGAQPDTTAGLMGGKMPSLDDMKRMADKQAAPLLEKIKSDPNNTQLLVQIGRIYTSTHQFKEAAVYYGKALQVEPKNVPTRTELASCMYYDGDVDGAINQLEQSLHFDPKDADSLFNLGMIKWQGKQDGPGALAAWQELLESNPQLNADRKATVQKLIAEARKKGKS